MQKIACFRSIVTVACGLWAAGAGAEAPSFRQIVGHEFGERITQHHQMVSYLRAVAEASPRVRVVDQGNSWEGRELLLAVVTSPGNHARLDEIRAAALRLADPRTTSPAEAREIAARQPAILYYGGSIHGFELSGSEAVLKLLERLATRDDDETLAVLDGAVLLLDPMLNPDGRDAFALRNHESIGRRLNPSPDDWANDFTFWDALRYRTGHYFFDINRDWWAHTQRETRARVPTLQAWRPQVVVDLHEMGPDVEFFFDPATEPFGPFFPDYARRWFDRFGEAYAAAFDAAGFEYMTRERYNYFYPGYTTSYGSYQGAVGMLYEQGSSRGLALERPDESVRSLGDALEQQYTAAWAAAQTAAGDREELLLEYYAAHEAAVEAGRSGVARYLIEPGGDPALVAELADLLRRNGIEVGRLTGAERLTAVTDRGGRAVGDREFPAGTYVVEAAQPRHDLVRVLLEADVPVAADFLKAARERVDRGENPRFYDVTAWSLPLMFNLQGYASTDRRPLAAEPLAGSAAAAITLPGEAGYAYLIDGRQARALSALYHLKAAGFRAAVTTAPTRLAGLDLASGTVVVRVGQNDATVHAAVRDLAERFALDVAAVDTGLSEVGFPALGSGEVFPVRRPEVALLAGQPVHGYSFGWAWYVLDRQYEIPVTVRRVDSVASTPLDRFDVLVIPHLFSAEELAGRLREKGVERLKSWVEDGGSLVALGEAVDFVREHLELSSLRSWYEVEKKGADDEGPEPRRFDVPGAMLRVELDPRRWLASGYGSAELPALVDSDRVYLAPDGPPDGGQRVVGRYAAATDLRIAGQIWPESLERLGGAVFAYEERIGRGRVVLFAEDLNYRGYWRGADRLFLNAVVLSPSAP